MLGVCLSKEYHDTLERFFGQFAVDENARAKISSISEVTHQVNRLLLNG
jgi:hypothetical protein